MPGQLLFAGASNEPLAERLARASGIPLGKLTLARFADGERYVRIEEEVRGKEVLVLQSGSRPAAEHLLELLLIADAAKREGARNVTAIIPFFPFRRQERQVEKGEPVSAAVVAKALEAVGVDRVITMDLHKPTIRDLFRVSVTELSALTLFAHYLGKQPLPHLAILAPDAGSAPKAQELAQELTVPAFLGTKERGGHDAVAGIRVPQGVERKNLIILDDEISTGGTLLTLLRELARLEVASVRVCATHAVFAGETPRRLQESSLAEVIVTDTIVLPEEKRFPKLVVLSVAPLLADAVLAQR